jgi:hypothetical protein
VKFYGLREKCTKTSPRTLATKEPAVVSRQITAHISFFTTEFLTKNNNFIGYVAVFRAAFVCGHTIEQHSATGCYNIISKTTRPIELIEAESQAVLNIFIAHDFQVAFDKGQIISCCFSSTNLLKNLRPFMELEGLSLNYDHYTIHSNMNKSCLPLACKQQSLFLDGANTHEQDQHQL